MDRYMARKYSQKPLSAKKSDDGIVSWFKNLYERFLSLFKHEQNVNLQTLQSNGVTIVDENETPMQKIMKNVRKQPSQESIDEDIDPKLVAQTIKNNKI